MRVIWLLILILSLLGMGFIVGVAPEFFEFGGYIHRALVHAGTWVFAIAFAFAFVRLSQR